MNKQQGFTIIEVIVAIFILSVAVVGVFSAFSLIVILTSNASDRLTAAYLAQEGVEVVRNIRDNNWLKEGSPEGSQWYDGLWRCFDAEGCEVDYRTTADGPETVLPWAERDLNIINGFYAYDATNPSRTKFKRQIKISCLPYGDCSGGDDIMKVSVEVFWREKPSILNPSGEPGSIMVEETLYNWY